MGALFGCYCVALSAINVYGDTLCLALWMGIFLASTVYGDTTYLALCIIILSG